MEEIVLIAVLLAAAVFGFLLAARLDSFMAENFRYEKEDRETGGPDSVLLTGQSSDEDIAETISRFRETHGETRILIYDPSDGDAEGTLPE